MKKLLKKLTSRKFVTAMLGVITGICVLFGIDEGAVSTVAGAVLAAASAASYIIVEGRLDAESIKTAAEKGQEAIDVIKGK